MPLSKRKYFLEEKNPIFLKVNIPVDILKVHEQHGVLFHTK